MHGPGSIVAGRGHNALPVGPRRERTTGVPFGQFVAATRSRYSTEGACTQGELLLLAALLGVLPNCNPRMLALERSPSMIVQSTQGMPSCSVSRDPFYANRECCPARDEELSMRG